MGAFGEAKKWFDTQGHVPFIYAYKKQVLIKKRHRHQRQDRRSARHAGQDTSGAEGDKNGGDR